MENFAFNNPVKVIFGKDTIKQIADEIPAGSKVLLLYGGGSIKKNGVYDQAAAALKSFEWLEFGGIEPNPHYETCMKAIELIKREGVTFLLAVGGGSVLDAVKFIALGACFDGDPWDIIEKSAPVAKALPLGTVLTLFATGSEMNAGGVITKVSTQEKCAFGSPLAYPLFSVLDPTVTYSLPMKQVSNGIVDAFVHVMEQYLTDTYNAMVQDCFAESILRILISEGPKGLQSADNYEVRANLMWAATWALNGWIGCGVPSDWATHMIGHEITAFYGLDHAQTLAIVLPGVMERMAEQKANKIVRLGEQVFNLPAGMDRAEKIKATIKAVADFFEQVGVKTHLSDYGLGDEAVERVSKRMEARGWKLGELSNIDHKVVREILLLRK